MELIPEGLSATFAEGLAHLRLSAPERGNVISPALVRHLSDALERAAADDEVRVVLLTAAGEVFCRGLDFDAAFDAQQRPNRALFEGFRDCLQRITTLSKVVVAAVDGQVMGGGLGLVAAADIALAAEHASFSLPEAVSGMIPALVAPVLLPRIGPKKLAYLGLSTSEIDAHTARGMGLVDEVWEVHDLEERLRALIARIFRCSPPALARTKRYLHEGPNTGDALSLLLSWLQQPQVAAGLRDFTDGLAPPWFAKFKGTIHV